MARDVADGAADDHGRAMGVTIPVRQVADNPAKARGTGPVPVRGNPPFHRPAKGGR